MLHLHSRARSSRTHDSSVSSVCRKQLEHHHKLHVFQIESAVSDPKSAFQPFLESTSLSVETLLRDPDDGPWLSQGQDFGELIVGYIIRKRTNNDIRILKIATGHHHTLAFNV